MSVGISAKTVKSYNILLCSYLNVLKRSLLKLVPSCKELELSESIFGGILDFCLLAPCYNGPSWILDGRSLARQGHLQRVIKEDYTKLIVLVCYFSFDHASVSVK